MQTPAEGAGPESSGPANVVTIELTREDATRLYTAVRFRWAEAKKLFAAPSWADRTVRALERALGLEPAPEPDTAAIAKVYEDASEIR